MRHRVVVLVETQYTSYTTSTAPLKVLVLFLDDFTYMLEGYVLLIGAKRAHGRVATQDADEQGLVIPKCRMGEH